MKRSDQQIKKILSLSETYSEEALQDTIRRSRASFCKSEAQSMLTGAEFLYQQGKYIHKRWWVLQAAVLVILWVFFGLTVHEHYVQRCMGIAAPLFAVLVLPELWKNRNAGAMEVEGAAYYSLRQVYAARIFLFALVDLFLLSCFAFASVITGRLLLQEILVQFFLPYMVTCCICFRCLYSRIFGSELFSVSLCVIWSGIWTQIIVNERIYAAVSLPVWYSMLALATFYLGYCICRGQKSCRKIGEVNTQWN